MYTFEVTEIIRQPNNNITILFKDLTGNFPRYKAGQFLTLCFRFADREVRRSYSFSSSPDVDEAYAITVKRVDNGEISRLLHHEIAVGEHIEVMEPQGLFFYEPDGQTPRTLFLFAAGVGITPLYAILKTALTRDTLTKVVLVYSNGSAEKTLFYEELLAWQARFPDRLHIEWIFSSAKNLLKARLNRPYLLELVNQYQPTDGQALYYTCGPIFYMDLCRYTLLGMGIPDADIRKETFHFPEEESDDEEGEPEPVDTNSYEVTLRFQGEEHLLLVPYNESILNVGLAHKLKLPYSCKSGMCSTCISQCTAGSVRMDYNEVLTDREVENGKCLLCTAHPLESGTVIEVR